MEVCKSAMPQRKKCFGKTRCLEKYLCSELKATRVALIAIIIGTTNNHSNDKCH